MLWELIMSKMSQQGCLDRNSSKLLSRLVSWVCVKWSPSNSFLYFLLTVTWESECQSINILARGVMICLTQVGFPFVYCFNEFMTKVSNGCQSCHVVTDNVHYLQTQGWVSQTWGHKIQTILYKWFNNAFIACYQESQTIFVLFYVFILYLFMSQGSIYSIYTTLRSPLSIEQFNIIFM